jgi:excinuclease UvrABC nuclease subunit
MVCVMSRWTSFDFGPYFQDGSDLRTKLKEFMACYPQNLPGVYALYVNDNIVYIGSSEHLSNRLLNHRWAFIYNRPFTIKYSHSKKKGEWLMREYRLIKRIQPSKNSRYCNKKTRCQ